MATIAALSRPKHSRHLSHLMVSAKGWSLFWDRSDASLLYATVVLGPIPPVAEKTRGTNDPCSTSRTLWS